jgi:hypothetical protein
LELLAILILIVGVPLGVGWVGLQLFRDGLRKRREAEQLGARQPLPPAKIEDGRPVPRPTPPSRGVGRRFFGFIFMTLGFGTVAVIAWGIWYLFTDFSMTMGRRLRVRGRERLPKRALGTTWHASDARPASVEGLDRAEREALAAGWLEAARMEHASVPAFAQLSLQLAALGASADLFRRTHEAALDEVRHAERCYSLASDFGGERYAAGAIDALAAPGRGEPVTFERVACESLEDGCLAEGIAAEIARRGATTAIDPAVAETLAMIARDEARHAELAWDVLAWCLAHGGASCARAVASRRDRLARSCRAPAASRLSGDRLARHGFVPQDGLDAITRRCLADTLDRVDALLDDVGLASTAWSTHAMPRSREDQAPANPM